MKKVLLFLALFIPIVAKAQLGIGFINGKLLTGSDGTSPTDAVNFSQLDNKLAITAIRYAARLQTDASGNLTITWPAGSFDVGVTPVVSCDVECPSGTTNYVYSTMLMGTPTSTGCTVKVYRVLVSPVVSILGTLNLFTAPGATWVHVIVRIPT